MLSKNQIKNIQSLHLKKNRQAHRLFIAEGKKVVSEIISSGFPIETLYATSEWMNEFSENPVFEKRLFPLIEITEEELKKISTLTTPNHVLAICKTPEHKLNTRSIESELTLYLDGIRDPGNLGTIIRIADWFGISQIICSPDTTELYNPKTIQSTMGSFLRVNLIYATLPEIMDQLCQHHINPEIYGALLDGENIYTSQALKNGILVIGNESNGISDSVQQLITRKIKIPCSPLNGAESLNAAVATSIIVAEFFRVNSLSSIQ